jgi:hypothetical protein
MMGVIVIAVTIVITVSIAIVTDALPVIFPTS